MFVLGGTCLFCDEIKALKMGSFSALGSVTPRGTCCLGRMSLPMEQFLWTLASCSVGFRGQIRVIWPSLCLLTQDRL